MGEAIADKQTQMSSLSEKITVLETRAIVADRIQQRFDDFEKKFEKLDNDLKMAFASLDKMESVRKEFDAYQNVIAGFENTVSVLSEKVKGLDKLKKDISRASLMADELKARQKSLSDEDSLINKAIMAASKLEELIYRAEHINKEEK
jgi:predicted  nucleic acid-binding Zn-ribbon protein